MGNWKVEYDEEVGQHCIVYPFNGEDYAHYDTDVVGLEEICEAHNADIATMEATLAKLREIVPENIRKTGYCIQDVLRVHSILYPKGNNNE